MPSETKTCRNCDRGFDITSDDLGFYERMEVPPPTFCPDCRLQRRFIFRNERTYYKCTCDLCKKDIIATYPADAPHPVYCLKCWWSDKWDPLEYGRDFDFSRPFFEQFKELLWSAPALSIMNDDGVASTNCEYSYDWFYSKNCYMVFVGWYGENCMYMYHDERVKDMLDCAHVRDSELAYECLIGFKLNRCLYCTNCRECQNCFLSEDLQGCSNCVLCVGLRSKSYCIRNKQYTKEEYLKEVARMNLGSRAAIEKYQKEFESFRLGSPRRYAYLLKSVNTTGDYLSNCKNSKNCFFGNGLENCSFVVIHDGAKDSYDFNMTGKAELCYDCVTCDNAYGNKDTVFCIKSKFVEYSHYCPSAEWCFGCVGIKNGSYCIFNRKYSKEEYERLRGQIIEHMKGTGEWGEFFPHWVSPFAYNETAAQEWFPLSREEIESRGYLWREPETRDYQVTLRPDELPDTIEGVKDDVLKEVIGCEHAGTCNEKCTGAFRIILPELQLYRRLNVPLPRLCPNCRHYGRIGRRNPPKLYRRQCECLSAETSPKEVGYRNTVEHFHGEKPCPNVFETSYAPDRPEIVYCEQCYKKEIV